MKLFGVRDKSDGTDYYVIAPSYDGAVTAYKRKKTASTEDPDFIEDPLKVWIICAPEYLVIGA
jgi:hypothetical protein